MRTAYTINLCFAGSRAGWTRARWFQRRGTSGIAAYVAVRDCRRFGIPATVATPPYRRRIRDLRSRLRHRCLGHRRPTSTSATSSPGTYSPPTRRRHYATTITSNDRRRLPKPRDMVGKRLTDGETALRGPG